MGDRCWLMPSSSSIATIYLKLLQGEVYLYSSNASAGTWSVASELILLKALTAAVGSVSARQYTSTTLVQLENALKLIVVTNAGISILVNPLQLANAFFPIVPSVIGKVMEGKAVHFAKAASPIDSRFGGKVIDVNPVHPEKVLLAIEVIHDGRLSVCRAVQFMKAYSPMVVTV